MFFLSFFISYCFAEAPVKFFKEEVSLEVVKNSVTLQGLYFFENTSNFEMDVNVVYPFSIDSTHLYPDKIKISVDDNPIDFTKNKDGIRWTLHFAPNMVETVFVEYRQKIKEKSVTYILTSIKLWKDKLDKLTFIIKAPEEFKELNISIKPDSVKTKKGRLFYYITRRYFLPKEDLKISW